MNPIDSAQLMDLTIEAIVVGIVMCVLGIVLRYGLGLPCYQNLFLTGVIGHLVFEYAGVNAYYCRNGVACTSSNVCTPSNARTPSIKNCFE